MRLSGLAKAIGMNGSNNLNGLINVNGLNGLIGDSYTGGLMGSMRLIGDPEQKLVRLTKT